MALAATPVAIECPRPASFVATKISFEACGSLRRTSRQLVTDSVRGTTDLVALGRTPALLLPLRVGVGTTPGWATELFG
jgi:hypothetical protein